MSDKSKYDEAIELAKEWEKKANHYSLELVCDDTRWIQNRNTVDERRESLRDSILICSKLAQALLSCHEELRRDLKIDEAATYFKLSCRLSEENDALKAKYSLLEKRLAEAEEVILKMTQMTGAGEVFPRIEFLHAWEMANAYLHREIQSRDRDRE